MIITRTPLRISLCGGGTDMPAFYTQHGGAVVSLTIDKYIYVNINPKFDGKIRLSYSRTENVDHAENIKHDLVRLTLKWMALKGVEITSISDIPGEGSGLGSSSSFEVGLLHAISAYQGNEWCPKSLAEGAYMVEAELCGHPVGKQDQYAAAFGGLHFYEFQQDGGVRVEPFDMLDEELSFIMHHFLLVWTGRVRKSGEILRQQRSNMSNNGLYIHRANAMKDSAFLLRKELIQRNLTEIGPCLHENWMLKKEMAPGISDDKIDGLYDLAMQHGATGGKLCGAGGGGFLLFFAEPERHEEISAALGLRRIPVRLEEKGSTVIYNGEKR